jgi:NADPH:quinone reductase-like Zn-dependent oxidoreductase
MQTMRANVFHGPNDIRVEEVPRPSAGAGEAVIRITLTTFAAPISTFFEVSTL